MAKKNVSAESVVDAYNDYINLLNQYNAANGGSQVEDAEPEDVEEEEVELDAPEREHVESLGIKDLRALAAEYGIESKTKADILEAFEEFYDEEESEEDEDEDEVEEVEEDEDGDEDEDEDEEGEWDRDSLSELDLKELRAVAKEAGHSAADYRGMDQDALIDLILGEEEDADEDEDEDEDEDDVEELDEDALKAMTDKELTALAKELGVKVPTKVKSLKGKKLHDALVNLILDSGDEEE